MDLLLSRNSLLLPAAAWLVALFTPTTFAAIRIPLVIDEAFPERRVAWPITTGVPFPRGALRSPSQCRLVDDTGTEQQLQSRVAATWDADGSSVRWLTIDFIAQVGRRYTLEYGPGVARKRLPSQLAIVTRRTSEADPRPDLSEVRVTTGPLSVEFTGAAAAALSAVRLDHDGDSTSPPELVAHGAPDGEHHYTDQEGTKATSAEDHSARRIVLERTGPVRACVRVDGEYRPPTGQSIVHYRTRYHVYAGLPLIRVIDEFRITGSTRGRTFREIGFTLAFPGHTRNRRIVVDTDGTSGNQPRTIDWATASKEVTSFQTTYRHFGNPECSGGISVLEGNESPRRGQEHVVHTTDRVGEWLQVQTDHAAITGSARWMWQQFPKAWRVTPNTLTYDLWSARGGALDFSAQGILKFLGETGRRYLLDWPAGDPHNPVSRFFYRAGADALERGEGDGQGLNKHHEFWFHFAPLAAAQDGRQYGALAAKPPLALATPEWNCATNVFGPLQPRPNGSTDSYEGHRYEAVVDRLFDLGRYAQDTFGDYGWTVFGSGPHYSYQWDKETSRHYADPRRFEYHTYLKETQLWWCYLRSGARKFLEWALPSEDHWIDVATTHTALEYDSKWRGGERREQKLQLRPGDWSVDSPFFHLRQRDSAEAWLRGGSQFWASYHRTLETTTLAYYLTDDERYRDVLEFWRSYWSGLAGKTSASRDVASWFQEQPWFVTTGPAQPTRTWAEMIRDYAPFTSGLRHQMTMFYNLVTLYEHTWDPAIGQLVETCAAAYLDPDGPIGVWRTQENSLPAFADAPKLAHYWVPALWKYARTTLDPRMPKVLRKYFDACLLADPFLSNDEASRNIGVYSNTHLAYAYDSTRDPRFLRLALKELESLLVYAAPLSRPEDLWARLYNPYGPIRCFSGIPRLLRALDIARREGVSIPPPAWLKVQRTPIALFKRAGEAAKWILWGYDAEATFLDPQGRPFAGFEITTEQGASDKQPFDRVLPGFEVFRHHVRLPHEAAEGFYIVTPRLGLAVLEARPQPAPGQILVHAGWPVALSPGDRIHLRRTRRPGGLGFESARPRELQPLDSAGRDIEMHVEGSYATLDGHAAALELPLEFRVDTGNRPFDPRTWLRLTGRRSDDAWVSFAAPFKGVPPASVLRAVPPRLEQITPERVFARGRFGDSLHITPGRALHLPDRTVVDGNEVPLFDLAEGTIEFRVRQLWDTRLRKVEPVRFVDNGLVRAWCPRPLPLGEWAHVAVEWRPLQRAPQRQVVHIYVDGLDRRYYRNTWWKGYSQPLTFNGDRKELGKFIVATRPGAPYLIDELRISTIARYARRDVPFGPRQTFNPARFRPPQTPLSVDEHTALLLRFDGDLSVQSALAQGLTGTLAEK